jgi:hypothetical protein
MVNAPGNEPELSLPLPPELQPAQLPIARFTKNPPIAAIKTSEANKYFMLWTAESPDIVPSAVSVVVLQRRVAGIFTQGI